MRGKELLAALALITGVVAALAGGPPGRPGLRDATALAAAAGPAALLLEEPPYKRVLQGEDAKRAAALERQVKELWAAGKFAEAAGPAREVADLRRRAQGGDHWEARDADRNLETLRQADALPDDRRAALAEAPDTAAKAEQLTDRGKHGEAEPLYRRALAAFEKVLGPKHPLTATSYDNLAMNLLYRGRTQEAEPLFRKALAVREEVLGPRHPATAISYNNLAGNLGARGRRGEAEPLLRRALAAQEEVLGPRHPDTARGCNNLAMNLQDQGRPREAEPLFRKALALREEALGPRHRDTARSYNNLAVNLHAQGRTREAEPLLRTALAVWEEVLGPRHPDTARTYNNLAMILQDQGRPREAEPLHRKALALREEALGPRHRDTGESYHNLAFNLQAQGRARDAEPLYRKALAVFEEAAGPRHPHTAIISANLAYNLQAQGQAKQAEPLLRQARAVLEAALGPRHPSTGTIYNRLASNLVAQGRVQEAEPLYRKALAVSEEVLGPGHLYTAISSANLAGNLQAQGRAQDAERLWQEAAEGIEAARLRLAASALDKAAAVQIQPHAGLAACRARLGRPVEAWAAVEAGLARGLLDDLAARASLPPDPRRERRARERATRLDELDRLLFPLLVAAKPAEAERRRRDELLKERADLGDEATREAAGLSRQSVLSLDLIQARIAPEEALVFWVDLKTDPGAADSGGDHWGCVLRRAGEPTWVRLDGTGEKGVWAEADDKLPGRARGALSSGEADAPDLARRLGAQRLGPLAPHLGARGGLPVARRLVVVPVGRMAGVPVEALSDQYLVSYAPSGTVLARLREKHRPLAEPTLLALGDPNFALPVGDAPAVGRREGREQDLVTDSRDRSDVRPLPGTRLEVRALAALLPEGRAEVLLGSDASEQKLGALAASGRLKQFRLVHLATHGMIDPAQAGWSALLLARDKLPGPEEQAKLTAAGKKVPTGRLTVETIANEWQLDADLVCLSACETGLGPEGGGEGLLGFSQVLLAKGARSLVLSLWRVDDTATALLMVRFYENLLGKRDGLKAPLPKAEALREAKHWLRQLPRAEAEALAARLGKGELRASEVEARPVVRAEGKGGDAPYAHPRYWAAFILIGDPD
jgi:CHAT domain-containing protein/tetratricopeptide (TPR) repeat protein